MEHSIFKSGASAAGKLLDSGHIVVSVFLLLTVILIGLIYWLARAWRTERKECIRLSTLFTDMQIKNVMALKEQEHQIELLREAIHGR